MPISSVHGISQARILEWVTCHPAGDIPDPQELTSPVAPVLAVKFFTIVPRGKPLMPLISLLIGLHFYHLFGITEHCFTEFNVQFSF